MSKHVTKRFALSFRGNAYLLLVALLILSILIAACGTPAATTSTASEVEAPADTAATESNTIKVGILHSLSGTMSISEVSVRDATLLAIEQINASSGIMGEMLEPIVEDGASDWPTFAEKARKLIQ